MALLCICNISPPSQLPAHPPEAYLESWSKTTLKPCPGSNKATSYSTAQKDLKTFGKWLLSLGLAVHLPTVHHAASRRLPHLPSAAAQQQRSSSITAAWNVKGELKAEGCSPPNYAERGRPLFSACKQGEESPPDTYFIAPALDYQAPIICWWFAFAFIAQGNHVSSFHFCLLNEFSVTQCANTCRDLPMATSRGPRITFISTCGIPKVWGYTFMGTAVISSGWLISLKAVLLDICMLY